MKTTTKTNPVNLKNILTNVYKANQCTDLNDVQHALAQVRELIKIYGESPAIIKRLGSLFKKQNEFYIPAFDENGIDLEGIIKQINKEDKYGVAHILSHLVPANDFLSIALITYDTYKKPELLEKVMERQDKFYKLKGFQTYKKFFQDVQQ